MTSDENEVIIDRYLRKGKLRNIDDYYYFQPIEYGISQTTINEKRKPVEHKIGILLSTKDYLKIVKLKIVKLKIDKLKIKQTK